MATGDFGGDGSVKWRVDVDNVKHEKLKQEPKPGGSKGWIHEGVDNVAEGFFTISIRLPEGVTRLDQLPQAPGGSADGPGSVIKLSLPIEPGNDESGRWPQIRVRWPDALSGPAGFGRSKKAGPARSPGKVAKKVRGKGSQKRRGAARSTKRRKGR